MVERTTTAVLVLLILCPIFAMNDHCRNHTFDQPTNSEPLHFSKENSDREYGIYDKFKCLHCCSHGYRSIEWFKNGQLYPWPTDVSTFIVHPQSGNQTICTQQSTSFDSGRYWCVARNDTNFLRHDVHLQISGPSISLGWPKTTYRPRDQIADQGESVRFYCEAFVGTIDLPDFQSEITWERYDLNQSFINGKRVLQEIVFREEKRILGSYLIFKQVMREDYGEYKCKVRNVGDQVVELSAWLIRREEIPPLLETPRQQQFWSFFFLFCLLILVASTSTICFVRFGFLRLMSSSSAISTDDSRTDVLVICHKNDEQEALKTVSLLQRRCFCSYSLHPLQSRSQIGDENLKAKANSYREVLAILSPRILDGIWSCEGVHWFINSLLKVHFTVSCIFLQALPNPRTDSQTDHQLLKESLSKINYIDRCNNLKIWSIIREKFLCRRKNNTGSSQTLI